MPRARPVVRRPSPLARPRGVQLQLWRGPLSRAHLGFLVATTCYVAARHPSSLAPVLLVACIGCIGELAPATWRRFFVAESLLLASGVLSFLWVWNIDAPHLQHFGHERLQAFKGWVRIVFAAWLLVPSRPGYLRWMAALVAVELTVDGIASDIDPGRTVVLVATAVFAVAYDAHLRVATLRPEDVIVGRSQRRWALRWIGWTTAAVSAVALTSSFAVHGLVEPMDGSPLGGEGGDRRTEFGPLGPLDPTMRLDEQRFADQNTWVMARLSFEQQPAAGAMHYLRALTVPQIRTSGGRVSWTGADRATIEVGDQPVLYDHGRKEMATLFRRIDGSQAVLMPDGCGEVHLAGVMADRDGNLYRPGLGEINTRYNVDPGDLVHPLRSWENPRDPRYLQVPDRIRRQLRYEVPQIPEWSRLRPEEAAERITVWLQSRCSYQISDLPEPYAGPYGRLMRFLFSDRAEDRVGHCQFFSTAAVLLLRTAGHPARCVVGYASDERDDASVVFRALNAHAWIEIQSDWNGERHWQRVDPTPPDFLSQRRLGIDLEGEDDGEDLAAEAEEPDDPETGSDWRRFAWWAAAAFLVLGSASAVWWFRRSESGLGGRERLLAKRTESLIRTALALGIPIDRSCTLTSIVKVLQERSGVDLEAHLRAHLAARFGGGPVPEPWPLDAIREAVVHRPATTGPTCEPAKT